MQDAKAKKKRRDMDNTQCLWGLGDRGTEFRIGQGECVGVDVGDMQQDSRIGCPSARLPLPGWIGLRVGNDLSSGDDHAMLLIMTCVESAEVV